MATFLLVHGGGMGAWCWKHVIPALREHGHAVHAVTMTGSGDRRHLLNKDTSIETNVVDVAGALYFEDLEDCILVGHSQAGSVLPGVSLRAAERLRRLVYLDATLLRSGEALLAAIGAMTAEQCGALLNLVRSGEAPAAMDISEQQREAPSLFGVEVGPERISWMMERLTNAPATALVQPAEVGYERAATPSTYVACSRTMMQASHVRAREAGWPVIDVDTDHGLMFSEPERTAALLHEIAVAS